MKKLPRRQFVAMFAATSSPRTEAAQTLRLANRHIAFTFDAASGALTTMERRGGTRITLPPSAAAPIRLWLGTSESPDQLQPVICSAKKRKVRRRLRSSAAGQRLELEWRNVDSSGVDLKLTAELGADDEFLRLRAFVSNRGHLSVTGLFIGVESVSVGSDPRSEVLRTGDVTGRPIANPRENLPAGKAFVEYPAGRRSFSVPPTIPASLIVSWMDLSAPGVGLGCGYVDSREMDLVGDVRADATGISLGWRLFRLEGTRGFMWPYNGARQVYPLAPGERFESDVCLLAFHTGDWRRTARAYRQTYERELAGDFLDWPRTSPAIRNLDVILNSHVAWGNPSKDPKRPYDYPHGRVINRFDRIAPQVKEAVAAIGIAPQNVMVNVLGTGTNWGIYKMPDHFPMCPEAGGQAAAEEMLRDLASLGITNVCCYAHPYFHHREARNYTPSAETGLKYPHQSWDECMGGIANVADSGWQRLWREKIYPSYIAMGVNGLYFDEGFGHQFLAIGKDPRPSQTILTEQSRGATALYRAWRSMAGPAAFLSCESGSDVQGRWIDLWHFASPAVHLRYTHPDKLIKVHVDRKRVRQSIADAFLMGCPLLVAPFPGLGAPDRLEGELLESLRAFVQVRAALRASQAPGYPHGFQDTDGLTFTAPIQAKVYVAGSRCTVACFAPEAISGEVQWRGHRRPIQLEKNQMTFVVLG